MTDSVKSQGLGNQVAKGALWTISFRMADRLIGVISTLFLARLLTPADFGLVAMAVTLIAMIDVITVGEFGSAIIHEPNPPRDFYDTAWTLSAILGFSSMTLMLVGSIPIANFFNEPRLAPVVCALSLLPLMSGLFNMGCVDFRKHLDFRKDFLLQVGAKISGFVIVLPLAFMYRSYWALVGGMIAGRLGGLILSYRLHPFRPRVSLASAKRLFGFSSWLMLDNGLQFIRIRGAHFIIGRYAGTQSLGLYTISSEMANLPTSELANPINRAVFPGYSKLQGNLPALQAGFVNVVGLIALVAVPAGVGLSSVSHLFVPAVLGEKWLAAIPLISILAMGGSIQVLEANCQSLYFAMGRPRYRAMLTLLEIAVFLPMATWLLFKHGLQGAAYGLPITAAIVVPTNFILAARLLDMNPVRIVAVLWRPIIAAAFMWLVVRCAFPLSASPQGSWLALQSLAHAMILGAAFYVAAISLLWQSAGRPMGAERWLLDRVKAVISSRRPVP